MTITPTPAQTALAELNGWDPQETAVRAWRSNRTHELELKHTKAQLLQLVLDAGTQGLHHPSTWTKQELAGEVEHLEWVRREQSQEQQVTDGHPQAVDPAQALRMIRATAANGS